jgi:pyruvate formate lyase activating enzyme
MIAGIQKMTLLDYPGKVACTVFLQGCNFRCPFCHNSDLLPCGGQECMTEEALLAFLKKRIGLLDAVCVSGGEPTLYSGLEGLLRKIKALGYLVKLDTNGSRPGVLKALVAEKLVDYVAMDVKNCPTRYGQTVGVERINLAPMEESLAFLLSGVVDYEFRTTIVDEFHDEASILEMGQWLCGLVPGTKPKRLFLQPFRDRESVLFAGLHTPTGEKTELFRELLQPLADTVEIRGED